MQVRSVTFGALCCRVPLVDWNLISDKKLQQFCDKTLSAAFLSRNSSEIYGLRMCWYHLFLKDFQNAIQLSINLKKYNILIIFNTIMMINISSQAIWLGDDLWPTQTGQSRDNHLPHTILTCIIPCHHRHHRHATMLTSTIPCHHAPYTIQHHANLHPPPYHHATMHHTHHTPPC